MYPWNFVDQIICGEENELPENVKFWRIQFTLIPQAPSYTTKAEKDNIKLITEKEKIGKEKENVDNNVEKEGNILEKDVDNKEKEKIVDKDGTEEIVQKIVEERKRRFSLDNKDDVNEKTGLDVHSESILLVF